METIKRTIVYTVLYQYSDKDFSVISLNDSLEKAYSYICNIHKNDICNLVELNETDDNDTIMYNNECINICFCKTYDYYYLDTIDKDYISQYIIAQMFIS